MLKLKRGWILVLAVSTLLACWLGARAAYFRNVRSRVAAIHREHITLVVPPEVKRGVLAGRQDAIQWLEARLSSHSGSIPALIILAPRAGIDSSSIPDFISGYGICGNSTENEIVQGLRERLKNLEEIEASAVQRYFSGRTGTPPVYPPIDFRDSESVTVAFLGALERGDLSMLYLLLEDTKSARDDFWQFFRMHHHKIVVTRSIRKTAGGYYISEKRHGWKLAVLESGVPINFAVRDADGDGDLGVAMITFNQMP